MFIFMRRPATLQNLAVVITSCVTLVSILIIAPGPEIAKASTVTVESVAVDVNFTNATINGTTIANPAAGRVADLTQFGSSAGLNTADGIDFANTSGSSAQYLTGNLGTTTNMTKIVIEINAKFPDFG
jgi:hypothetical protein